MTVRIVVGVDGSDASRHALEFAMQAATRRGGRLIQAVYAWAPMVYWGGLEYGAGPALSRDEIEQDAYAVLDQVLAGVEVPDDLRLERIVVEGPAATALLTVAEGADLLVVGSRGRGGFAGLLLGSTSQQVTSHAHCPVLVVPPGVTATSKDDVGAGDGEVPV